MSNTSSDLVLSLPECNSSCCNRSKQNEDASKKNTSENYKVKSQSLSEDRSEHYARLLKESEQTLANRNVLISLLQDQLVKMEELYKKTLEKHSHYNMGSKSAEDAQVMKRNDGDEGKFKTEDKSLVKIFENLSKTCWDAQQNKKLDTIFEKSNKPEGLKTSSGELTTSVADSSDLSLVDSMRSLNVIHIKSVRSKIETEFFQECQVNFEGPENSKEISELLHAQEEIDSLQNKFHRLTRALEDSPNKRDEMESFFEQASKDESALEKALRSQKDIIKDLQRNMTNERIELRERNKNLFKQGNCNETQKNDTEARNKKITCDFSSFDEQSLYESPRHKRTMVESELRMLNEHLFQKEYVINAQQKKMRRLEDKLERTYQELIKQLIKNKKQCCDSEGRLDTGYRNVQKKNSELKIEETQQYEGTTGSLQNKLSCMMAQMEKVKNEKLDEFNARQGIMNLEQSKVDLNEKLSSLFGKSKEGESLQSLTIEEVKSQVTMAIKREQDVDVLQTKIIQMVSELENANKEITKCVDQNRTLLEDYEVKLEHVQNQYRLAKEENDMLKNKTYVEIAKANENLEAAIQQRDVHVKQLQQELEKEKEITNNLSQSQETLLQENSLVAELRENLNSATNLKEALESKLLEKDKRIETLDQNFKQMAEELDNTNKERAHFIQEVQKLFCEYDVKLAVIKDDCENAQKKIMKLKEHKSALHLQLTTAQTEAEKLKQDYQTLNLHKQTMEEELRNEIARKEKELIASTSGSEKRHLEEEVKSLRATVSQQKEQLENSNKNRANLMNEIKKLEGEMETKAAQGHNLQIKIAMLLKQLEDSEREREAYIEKNKKLFCRYENEMRQLNDDCEKTRKEIRRLKREKEVKLFGEDDLSRNQLGELRTRVIQLEEDKENLQKLIFNYEEQLENQSEEYDRKAVLIDESKSERRDYSVQLVKEMQLQAGISLQKEEEINKLRGRISEMEIALEAAEKKMNLMNQNKVSEASLSGKSSNYSIPAIKEESVLEAYEELVTEKEILESKLKETEVALANERESKTRLEDELFRFRENEKTVNENLRKILPEFLGQGDKNETKTNTLGEGRTAFDLQNKLSLLSAELENAKAEKWELIKKGKQIFYHYEANIIKLKNDYERARNEMSQIRVSVDDESLSLICKQGDLRSEKKEYGERLGKISTHYKSIKEEAQNLKESQEAYSKRLTCCLKELAIYKDDVKNWMEAYDKVVKEKSDLETETKILVNNVLHKDEVIKEMQDKLCNAEEKLENVTKANVEKEKIIFDYNDKYNRLSCEYEDAQNKVGQLKQSKDEMNQKITMKDKVIRQYEEQVDSERNENARLNEDIAILKTKLSTLEEVIEEKEKDFYVQLDETKSALFDVTQNYEKLEIEYGYLTEQQEDIRFYKMENANLIREIEERDENIKSLKGEIEELEKEMCNVRTEVDLNNASASLNWEELQSACADLEKKLELTKYALKKQECQAMIKADDDFKDLQRQIETLKEKLDCKDEENLRLSGKLEREQKEKTELNLHMANTMRELEGEIEDIKSNNRILREQITDRSQLLLQQKQHETSKENECETLKQQLKEAYTQKTSLEADVHKLRETLQAAENKGASLKSKNEKLQADLSLMEKELLMNKSWKTENAQLQEKLDNIESELFGVKRQCSEVHEQLKTTKIKLAETQEELSSTKRDLDSARSSVSACGVEIKNERQFSRSYLVNDVEAGSFFSSKTETMRDGDGRSICMKVNLEKRNFQESDTIKLNKHITVLYNNTKFSESRCETESTISNIMLARGSKIQERLASLNQMEKEVEEMISAVQQQNKKLRDCHMARVKNEKDIDTRLQKVRQRRDTLATDFNTFQAEIGHGIDHAISIRKQFENT